MDTQGAAFDELIDDGQVINIGGLEMTAMHTPGHTPACMTFVCGLDAFVGDTLFMPDYGSARCDFPGGDAATLYRSIRKVLSLDPVTRLHLCHDYPPASREPVWVSTVRRNDVKTSMCMTALQKRSLSACATPVTRRWRCRCSFCLQCK